MPITVPQKKFLDFAVSSASFSVSFTSGIAAGSIIVVAGSFQAQSGLTVTLDDGHGDTVTDSGKGVPNVVGLFSFVKAFFSPTTGAQTITATYSGGTDPTFGDMAIWEVAGLTSASFDKVVDANGTAATADSGTSGTLTNANEACFGYGYATTNFTAAGASPWISDGITATTGSLAEHQIVSATTALDATGTVNTPASWQMWFASVMGAGTTPTLFAFNPDVLEFPLAGQNVRRQLDAFAYVDSFFGVVVRSSIQWPWTNIQDVPQPPKQQRDVFLFHSPFVGTKVQSSIQWPWTNIQDVPQRPKKDWSQTGFEPQKIVTFNTFGGALTVGQDVPQLPKQQRDVFLFHSPFVGTIVRSSIQWPWSNYQDVPFVTKKDWSQTGFAPQPIVTFNTFGGALTVGQDIPQLPKKQWDQFTFFAQANLTPTAFPYQLQQDVPQLPKQQRDVFSFHSPFGLYVPSFSYQLQQDIPQLPKKQWDQFAFFTQFNLTPNIFGSFQSQQDTPQLPKKDWSTTQNAPQPITVTGVFGGAFTTTQDTAPFKPKQQQDQFAFPSLFFGTLTPSSFAYQLQQDVPQLPKKDWSAFSNPPQSFVTATPTAFGYQLQQDVPQLPKQQRDVFAFHSPYGLYSPSFSWQVQQDFPQLPKKQLDVLAWHSPFVGTLTQSSFSYQLQVDVPFRPYQQRDTFAFHTPFGLYVPSFSYQLQQDVPPQLPKKDWSTAQNVPQPFITVPPAFSWQIQQDVPQPVKKQLDIFTATAPVTVVASDPGIFGSFTNHPDLPQLPKQQRDAFAWHSPFSGTKTQNFLGSYFATYSQETAYPNYKTVLLFVNAFNGQIIVQATFKKIYSYITSSYIQ